jgi:hypothetical protein
VPPSDITAPYETLGLGEAVIYSAEVIAASEAIISSVKITQDLVIGLPKTQRQIAS